MYTYALWVWWLKSAAVDCCDVEVTEVTLTLRSALQLVDLSTSLYVASDVAVTWAGSRDVIRSYVAPPCWLSRELTKSVHNGNLSHYDQSVASLLWGATLSRVDTRKKKIVAEFTKNGTSISSYGIWKSVALLPKSAEGGISPRILAAIISAPLFMFYFLLSFFTNTYLCLV